MVEPVQLDLVLSNSCTMVSLFARSVCDIQIGVICVDMEEIHI